MTPWDRFATVARGGQADCAPVALIVDSPWLPGYAGVGMLDFFLREDVWLHIHLGLLERFPDVAWIPGFWIEYGMAAEPSAFGARIAWEPDQPPSIGPVLGGMAALANVEPADPFKDGLMPLILDRYAHAEKRLLPEGMNIKLVAARGPFAVAGWLLGMSDFLVTLQTEPEASTRLLDVLTTTIIAWLRAQMSVLRRPEGILLLDDIAGLLSPRLYDQFVPPVMQRIFAEFQGMIRIYHNDTPCPHLVERLGKLGFDVFNFSHTMDIGDVQRKMPGTVLMGNVPPMEMLASGTPDEVETWVRDSLRKTGGRGIIVSAGGGASPGTRAENIDAMVRAAREPVAHS